MSWRYICRIEIFNRRNLQILIFILSWKYDSWEKIPASMLKSPKYRYHGSLLNIACYHAMYRNRSHLKQPGESKLENWMLRQLLLPCTLTARGTFYIENLILKFWEELNKKHQDISQEWDYMYLPWTARSRVLVSIFFWYTGTSIQQFLRVLQIKSDMYNFIVHTY